MTDEEPLEHEPPFPPDPNEPKPPAPPPAGLLKPDESPMVEYMRHKLESLERELIRSKEEATSAKNLLEHQEKLRGEVESHLKSISAELKREKELRDLEETKQQSAGRVEALEKRLDEMHASWAGLLKDAIQNQEAGRESVAPRLESVTTEFTAVRDEIGRLKDELSAVRKALAPVDDLAAEVDSLRRAVPESNRRRALEDKALRDELAGLADRLGETVTQRLEAIDKRIAREVHENQDRLSSIQRERDAVREAVEEQHHRIRQEHLKERTALEEQFSRRVDELKQSLESFGERQSASADLLSKLHRLSDDVHAIISRPSSAKDQMVADLEREKRDLLLALKQRGEELRSYTLERRDVEHSLGESLMDANRELELERAKHRELEEKISAQQGEIERLKGEAALAEEGGRAKDERYAQLAEERDRLAQALAEEAAKVSAQIDSRTDSDRRWEARILDMQKRVDDEREKRLKTEESTSALRDQINTLSEHLSRVLKEKERTEHQYGEWLRERENIQASLKKKDEMIGMLSSTFQNLLKKPAG
jgi:chromosome segregation ATPase